MSIGTWTGKAWNRPLSDQEQRERGLPMGRRWYEFQNDKEDRVTLDLDGSQYRPRDGLIHDFGSIPSIVQILPRFRKDRYPKSVILHDDAYGHKLWQKHGLLWIDLPITRKVADELLYAGIRAEGGPAHVAWLYYTAVRLFGGAYWRD